MSSNNLGMDKVPERKVQAALKQLANELRRKCHPRHAWPMASIAAKSCGRSRASKKV